jgi:hypothetical protein
MSEAVTRRNDGESWSDEEVAQLRELAQGNTPAGVMSVKLSRTEEAIRSKGSGRGDLVVAAQSVSVR